jgi:membrane protein
VGEVLPSTASSLVRQVLAQTAAAFLLILALLGLCRFAPNIPQQRLKWLLPGSAFAAVVWMVASILFNVYVRHFSHFGLLYGSLSTLIILMFWFYLSGIVILAGGEINAILEDAAAQREIPGVKRCGQRILAKLPK